MTVSIKVIVQKLSSKWLFKNPKRHLKISVIKEHVKSEDRRVSSQRFNLWHVEIKNNS